MYPICSFEEAVKRARCEQNEFLSAGVNGRIEFLVAVPDGYSLRLIKDDQSLQITGKPWIMAVPDLLVLKSEHCHSLILCGKAQVRIVSKGYIFNNRDTRLRVTLPSDADESLPLLDRKSVSWRDPRRKWSSWSIGKIGSDTPLEVSLENLRVAYHEINKFLGLDPNKPGDVGKEYKFENLHYMELAAKKYWGYEKIILDDRSTYPKNDQVAKWLEIDYEFTKKLAEAAATIIRPGDEEMNRPIEVIHSDSKNPTKKHDYYRSDKLELLCQVARNTWGHPSVQKNNRSTHPLKDDILSILRKHNFSDDLAQHAFNLLIPEFAKKAPFQRNHNSTKETQLKPSKTSDLKQQRTSAAESNPGTDQKFDTSLLGSFPGKSDDSP
jgi:hypothetical protein